jgi:hypothetical protein
LKGERNAHPSDVRDRVTGNTQSFFRYFRRLNSFDVRPLLGYRLESGILGVVVPFAVRSGSKHHRSVDIRLFRMAGVGPSSNHTNYLIDIAIFVAS